MTCAAPGNTSGFELAKNAWIVAAPDVRLAGYAAVWDREPGARFVFDGYVLPAVCGHGF